MVTLKCAVKRETEGKVYLDTLVHLFKFFILHLLIITVTWLAQMGEHQSSEWEFVSSNPGRTNTHGLNITEEKVLPLQ